MFASPGAIAIQIGPLAIRWYGLLIVGGIVLGIVLAYCEVRRRGEDPVQLMDVILVAMVGSLVGGRLYYVLLDWQFYAQQPMKILAIWEGGTGIFGVILGALLGIGLYSRLKGLSLFLYLDILAPSTALAQAIGRWGNFFNQEAFGTPTELPWKLYIPLDHRPLHLLQYRYFHPTFLYESLWNLLVFVVLFFLLRKRLERMPGALVLVYLGLYSLGRFCIEPLRVDRLMLGPFRAPQVISVLLFLVSAGGLVYLWRQSRAAGFGATGRAESERK